MAFLDLSSKLYMSNVFSMYKYVFTDTNEKTPGTLRKKSWAHLQITRGLAP